jgi:hypothetical protein
VPEAARERIVEGLGSGAAASGGASEEVVRAGEEAFVSALSAGLLVGAGAALVAALLAAWLIADRPARPVVLPVGDAGAPEAAEPAARAA